MPTNHKILHYNSIRRERESPKYYYSINQFLEPLSMPRQEKKKKREWNNPEIVKGTNQLNNTRRFSHSNKSKIKLATLKRCCK